ncbi:hypothetical protein OIE66_30780 [Nonomuraea sp. NBC_01738]|uniref:hypothetical protein n=1 Tax=Nonomuraea sp. NBC_01738 TaxID=2976003 RepID=UPI002E108719|nr:hypothetical protein OIE66_30780 [Nonomuraea sp. NBC_01738]
MSYPPIRYTEDKGLDGAAVRPHDAQPDLRIPARTPDGPKPGTDVHYLATGATTGGEFGLYRWEMGPNPSGPSAHFHRTMTESFYVLDGVIRFFNGK